MVKNKKRRGIDSLWLVLIVALLALFFSIATQKDDLEKEAETIVDALTDNKEYSFTVGNTVHEERLERVSGMTYSELKENLNVKNEFCVYFEDENGNLVEGMTIIGSDKIKINGRPCGK